ncbi:MAG: MotA/TolQ/ExbB proton channel family protein [Clostridia bacterium]|nr:MotA/TolQ/ExbB proton channel family protein [Clostridia bacterium]
METIQRVLQSLSGNIIDVIVYSLIGLVTLIGIFKCIMPLRQSIHCLKRAVRVLNHNPSRENGAPIWENELFMGRGMMNAWRRFLQNAQQLDARGMTCDVREYINDDTAIYEIGNIPLSEMVPGLLTSLGILGTFLGLMRGLGGLDVSDAAKTMASIPTMIGGMSFAFTTSIAGVGCSLIFQLINRFTMGNAMNALTDFQDTFSDIVMQTPLTAETRAICQREDQSLYLRHVVNDMSNAMAERLSGAVEQSFTPIAQQMNAFIAGQTQTQLESLNMITRRFLENMNAQLGGQFHQLGQTLSEINRSQKASYDAVDRSMATADNIIHEFEHVQKVTLEIIGRFDQYVSKLSDGLAQEDVFTRTATDIISQMGHAARIQSDNLIQIQAQQEDLQAALQDYQLRSKQTMQHIVDRADEQGRDADTVAKQMQASGKLLQTSYAKLVENVTVSFSQALTNLNDSMNRLTRALTERSEILNAQGASAADARVIADLSELSQAASGIEAVLNTDGGHGAV